MERWLSVVEAADRLAIEPAAVRAFARLGMLRACGADNAVWAADVDRLQRELQQRTAGAHALPAVLAVPV